MREDLRLTDENELLDISEAARLLNVSETSLRRWTNAGALDCLRVGRRRERRFRREDLVSFMEHPAGGQRSAEKHQAPTTARRSQSEPITVTQGNHLCGIYGTDAGLLSLCIPFLLEGLREGSVCIVVASAPAQKRILKSLRELHPTLPADIDEGRLVIHKHQGSAKAQGELFESLLEKAERAGATSFRIVGETSGMRATSSLEDLIEVETQVDVRITPRFPVAVLCPYDARQFSGVELLNALKAHRDTLKFPLGRSLA